MNGQRENRGTEGRKDGRRIQSADVRQRGGGEIPRRIVLLKTSLLTRSMSFSQQGHIFLKN